MTDDTFRLTPLDVRSHDFAVAWRGYDRAQVDEFKQRVAAELDQALRDRVQAEERLKSVTDQLRVYRERERALNEALLAAQQLRADAQAQAERERELVRREAEREASRIVDGARVEEQLVRERTEAAMRQFSAYVAAFRLLLERQLAEVEALQVAARGTEKVARELAGATERAGGGGGGGAA